MIKQITKKFMEISRKFEEYQIQSKFYKNLGDY